MTLKFHNCKMRIKLFVISLLALLSLYSCGERSAHSVPENVILSEVSFCGEKISASYSPSFVPLEDVSIDFTFTKSLDGDKFDSSKLLVSGADESSFAFSVNESDPKTLHVASVAKLPAFSKITVKLPAGENLGVRLLDDVLISFTTVYDPSDKFARLSDDELFEKVQKAAFSYFWDYAHPVSGLARERLGSGDTVTIGGSGFGLMTIPVGVERGWISREEAVTRVLQSVEFLHDKAERFHGVWPHWLDGTTGKTIAFSTYDDGADLVESAFMIQGLLTLKQYFSEDNDAESRIRSLIDTLWREVEWSWFRQDGQDKLYWHWSANHGWKMNMPISGWNEGLIVYVLAASSPTYPIDAEVYDSGWARNGEMRNGKSFYDVTLPLGENYGGPLFFSHYSFLGLDPRHLKDKYADYWEQNTAHARINWLYCSNAGESKGYSSECWGLTASDIPGGYTASSPTNDCATIAPTAALASFPYMPEESRAAMEYFYYVLGDNLWGEYGLKDSFSLRDKWFAPSYLAIDEGPIVVMMENYRTGLLWDCFMQDEDVQRGLQILGFEWK